MPQPPHSVSAPEIPVLCCSGCTYSAWSATPPPAARYEPAFLPALHDTASGSGSSVEHHPARKVEKNKVLRDTMTQKKYFRWVGMMLNLQTPLSDEASAGGAQYAPYWPSAPEWPCARKVGQAHTETLPQCNLLLECNGKGKTPHFSCRSARFAASL